MIDKNDHVLNMVCLFLKIDHVPTMVHKILRYHSETNRTAVYIIMISVSPYALKNSPLFVSQSRSFNFSSKLVQFVVINNNVRGCRMKQFMVRNIPEKQLRALMI